MFVKFSCVFLLALAFVHAAENENVGLRIAYKIYDECARAEGFVPCLKKKAITFMDRVSKVDTLPISEGLTMVKTAETGIAPLNSETELEQTLPRGSEARDLILSNMLMDRIYAFFNSRTIQITFPSMSSQEIGRAIEEGRGKMKKMMGMMMTGFAMKMLGLMPLGIAGLFVLAGKALITSKIALLLASIIALKKLVVAKAAAKAAVIGGLKKKLVGSGFDHHEHDDSYYRRSMNDAHDIAYRGHTEQ